MADTAGATVLYTHRARPHTVRHAGDAHREALAHGSTWERTQAAIALHASAALGSMTAVYAFTILAFTGFPGVPWLMCSPQAFTAWLSSQTIQLIALPLLGVASALLAKRSDHAANEQYKAVLNAEHMDAEIAAHLNAQDAAILELRALLLARLPEPKPRGANGQFVRRDSVSLTAPAGSL